MLLNTNEEWLRSAVCIVPDTFGHVLVMWNQKVQSWVFPGGKVEPGESPACAAKRELYEETGVPAQLVLPIFAGPNGPTGIGRMVHLFVAIQARSSGAPQMMEEGSPVTWLPLDEVLKCSKHGAFYRDVFTSFGDDIAL